MHILSHQIIANPQLSRPEAIVSAEIKVCVPDKLGSLSSAANKEWKRFYQERLKHEKKHVADGVKVAQQMLNDLTVLSVTMKTEDGERGGDEEAGQSDRAWQRQAEDIRGVMGSARGDRGGPKHPGREGDRAWCPAGARTGTVRFPAGAGPMPGPDCSAAASSGR